MKFKDIKYSRPDIKKIDERVELLLSKMKECGGAEEERELFLKIVKLQKNFYTMRELVNIRYSVNTLDEFYGEEIKVMDSLGPEFSKINEKIADSVLASKNISEYEKWFGKRFIDMLKLQKKIFSDEVLEDLKKEASLESDYQKLLGSAEIEFRGKKHTIPEMTAYLTGADRTLRKSAYNELANYYMGIMDKLDEIYDKLVKLRDSIAKRLGYENFIKLAYDRLSRTDYDEKDVKVYREQIVKYVVPKAKEIFEKQRKNLGLDRLFFYDEGVDFKDGAPKPKGTMDEIVKNARDMYDELSDETSKFFRLLLEGELMDLVSKKGKANGGFCTFIEDYHVPFIFANFNGTSGDIDVLTHEFGHALQVYSSRFVDIPDQRFPGYEAAEIHSMGMEFITAPYMEKFFKEDADKFKYHQVKDALTFLPYGALVDHFQHEVYSKVDMTPEERRMKWLELEKVYLPWRDYDDSKYNKIGGTWQRQLHIYTAPFYYIDYTLAQVVAFEILRRSREDFKALWKDYLEICKVGGRFTFTEILKIGNLSNPMIEGNVEKCVEYVSGYMDKLGETI
ncbi:MAG: oligoendopeptidase F [Clostridiales bacterium]|nr:MAG: oligoendopeptidase F [Clostridiales bacterium]